MRLFQSDKEHESYLALLRAEFSEAPCTAEIKLLRDAAYHLVLASPQKVTLSRLKQSGVSEAVSEAAMADLALSAFLRNQNGALEDIRLSENQSASARGTATRAFVLFLEGELSTAHDSCVTAIDASRKESDHVALLDATTVLSLCLLEQGKLDEARKQARLASRMARSEGVLQREYFANIALARVRRFDGHIHAAIRILQALAQVTPTVWYDWLDYELQLCGSHLQRDSKGDFALALVSQHSASQHSALPSFIQTEVTRLSLRADATVQTDDLWCRGEQNEIGFGLSALLEQEDPTRGAFVVASPHQQARRALFLGSDDSHKDSQWLTDTTQPRPLEVLATLLLSSPMEDSVLFEKMYGFTYVPDKHSGTLRTQLYRARKVAEGIATITRESGVLRAKILQAVCVRDPRSKPSIEESVLRTIGQTPTNVSASEIAKHMKVPLRSIQRILKSLVEQGICEIQKSGRRVVYHVEDTTFFEPSLTRLKRS